MASKVSASPVPGNPDGVNKTSCINRDCAIKSAAIASAVVAVALAAIATLAITGVALTAIGSVGTYAIYGGAGLLLATAAALAIKQACCNKKGSSTELTENKIEAEAEAEIARIAEMTTRNTYALDLADFPRKADQIGLMKAIVENTNLTNITIRGDIDNEALAALNFAVAVELTLTDVTAAQEEAVTELVRAMVEDSTLVITDSPLAGESGVVERLEAANSNVTITGQYDY